MPRYFFHLADHTFDRDREGTEFPDNDSARVQAVIFAGEYLRDNPHMLRDGKEFRVVVTKEDGSVLLTVVVLAVDTPKVISGNA